MKTDLIDKLKENLVTKSDTARDVAEVLGQMSIAKKFPRDLKLVEKKLMEICSNKSFAEDSYYIVPRGKEEIEGGSIRLAEAVACCYGNINFGISTEEKEDGESTDYTVYAIDLESNVRIQRTFNRKHIRKAGGKIYKVTGPQPVYEIVAADAGKRLRACLFNVVPKYLVDLARKKCKQTLAEASHASREEIINRIIVAFKEFNVSKSDLELKIEKQLTAIDANDLTILRGTLNTLKQGIMTRDEIFPKPKGETNEIQ